MPILAAAFSIGRRSLRLSKRAKKWTLAGKLFADKFLSSLSFFMGMNALVVCEFQQMLIAMLTSDKLCTKLPI